MSQAPNLESSVGINWNHKKKSRSEKLWKVLSQLPLSFKNILISI